MNDILVPTQSRVKSSRTPGSTSLSLSLESSQTNCINANLTIAYKIISTIDARRPPDRSSNQLRHTNKRGASRRHFYAPRFQPPDLTHARVSAGRITVCQSNPASGLCRANSALCSVKAAPPGLSTPRGSSFLFCCLQILT